MPKSKGWMGLVGVLCIAGGAFVLAGAGGRAAADGPDPKDVAAQKAAQETLNMNKTYDKGLKPTGHSVPAGETALEYATFGAGCFWGVEATFRRTPGVVATGVGYAGGKVDNPTYKQVCYEDTGHAEVVHIQFDPGVVSYDALLDIFWANHNPTTLNRQGPDVGEQYRSVIFFHGESQKAAAEKSKQAQQKNGKWASRTIVTIIEQAPKVYLAEEYHQQYLEKRGLATCH